jgi:hypothetical protein
VARCLLKEIIPQFGIPVSIGSENGPAFVAEVVQLGTWGLVITWKLHTDYCSKSSGKVECMKRTLKLQLGKLCHKTHLQWDQLLLIALLRIRSSPMKQADVLYGCPPPQSRAYGGTLGLTLSKINDWGQERLPVSLATPMHLTG